MSDDPGGRRFATTQWSIVAAAAGRSAEADSALASLCESYWRPIYGYIRRTGASPDDARDLTQAFFVKVLENRDFRHARRERGRFRTFLLTCVQHFLANERDAARALKRGGGRLPLPLEFDDGERQYLIEPTDNETPETLYERRWAQTIMTQAAAQLSLRHADAKSARLIDAFGPLLTGADGVYAELAHSLGMTEG